MDLRSTFMLYFRLFRVPLLTTTAVVGMFLIAMHAPSPEGVKIAVVGDAAQLEPLVTGLQSGLGDTFELAVIADADTARQEVQERDIAAAIVLSATEDDRTYGEHYAYSTNLPEAQQQTSAVIYVASAGGAALAQSSIVPLQTVAAQLGLHAQVQDLVPLADDDQAGNSAMWFVMALTMPAYVGTTMLGMAAKDLLRVSTLVKALPLFGVAASVLAIVLTSFVVDRFDWTVLPLLVTGTLYLMAVGFASVFITRVAGQYATTLAMVVFMGIGMPSSGIAMPVEFVPKFFQFFHPFMPYGHAGEAFRSIVYFDFDGIWLHWMALAAWVVLGIAALQLLKRWKPEPQAVEVEATVGGGGASGTLATA